MDLNEQLSRMDQLMNITENLDLSTMTYQEVKAAFKEIKRKAAKGGTLTPEERNLYDTVKKNNKEISEWYWVQLEDWCRAAKVKLEKIDTYQFKLTKFTHNGYYPSGANKWITKSLIIYPTSESWSEVGTSHQGRFVGDNHDFIAFVERFFNTYI